MRASYLVRYFQQVGREWQLKDEVRNLCRFAEGNLAKNPVGVPRCDVVFLRNVLIYFDVPTKRKVLANVRQVLKPGGYLVLGGAESTLTLDDAFTRVEVGKTSVYRLSGGKA
jgi:chemotaxis protein methyltransferase CheR